MSEREWYGSAEHFNTEMSYEEYLKQFKKKSSIDPLDMDLPFEF